MILSTCYITQIDKLSRLMNVFYNKRLKEHTSLTSKQIILLRALLDGPLTQIDLSNNLGFDRSTITRNTAALIELKFVKVYHMEDRRKKIFSLADKGYEFIKNNEDTWTEIEREIEGFSAKKAFPLQKLHTLVQQMSEMVCKLRKEIQREQFC